MGVALGRGARVATGAAARVATRRRGKRGGRRTRGGDESLPVRLSIALCVLSMTVRCDKDANSESPLSRNCLGKHRAAPLEFRCPLQLPRSVATTLLLLIRFGPGKHQTYTTDVQHRSVRWCCRLLFAASCNLVTPCAPARRGEQPRTPHCASCPALFVVPACAPARTTTETSVTASTLWTTDDQVGARPQRLLAAAKPAEPAVAGAWAWRGTPSPVSARHCVGPLPGGHSSGRSPTRGERHERR